MLTSNALMEQYINSQSNRRKEDIKDKRRDTGKLGSIPNLLGYLEHFSKTN